MGLTMMFITDDKQRWGRDEMSSHGGRLAEAGVALYEALIARKNGDTGEIGQILWYEDARDIDEAIAMRRQFFEDAREEYDRVTAEWLLKAT